MKSKGNLTAPLNIPDALVAQFAAGSCDVAEPLSKAEVAAEFNSAGLSFSKFAFSPDEEACISRKIKILKDEGYNDDKQRVAIAIKHCAPSKSTADHSKMSAGTAPLVGADYTAFDMGNGWYKIKNVLMFSEVPKGMKDAPEDVKRERMVQMVRTAQAKWEQERYAAPVHKGHHKLLEFSDPEFLGFVLPTAVGRHVLDGKMQDVVFGEVTLKESAFARILKGELPYLSPEVDWVNWKFSSLSFLDSKPPHFEFPLVTIGNVVKDGSSRFEVRLTSVGGKFMAVEDPKADKQRKEEYKEKEGGEPKEDAKKKDFKPHDDRGDEKIEGAPEEEAREGGDRLKKLEMGYSEMDKAMASIHFKMGLPYKGALMEAEKFAKPESSAPVEDEKKGDEVGKVSGTQTETKFGADPETRAAFAAQELRTKALEDKLAKRDADEALKLRVAAAFEDLKGRPMSDTVKADIAYFAGLGEDSLKKYVAALKAQTPMDPPKNLATYEALGITKPVGAVMATDADIAEFAKQGPEKGAAAQRWATAFEVWKASPFSKRSSLRDNRKVWIEEQMRVDPTGKTADTLIGGAL